VCTWNRTRFKNELQRFLNLKKCDKIGTKDLNFGRTWLKPVLGELSQKFLNVRTGLEVLLKRKNHRTLEITGTQTSLEPCALNAEFQTFHTQI
jgi:hypothetical protein